MAFSGFRRRRNACEPWQQEFVCVCVCLVKGGEGVICSVIACSYSLRLQVTPRINIAYEFGHSPGTLLFCLGAPLTSLPRPPSPTPTFPPSYSTSNFFFFFSLSPGVIQLRYIFPYTSFLGSVGKTIYLVAKFLNEIVKKYCGRTLVLHA